MKNHLGINPQGYYAIVSNQKVYNKDEVVEIMLGRGAALTRADIEGALTCLNKAILQIVGNGEGLNMGLYTMHIDIKGSFPDANSLFDRSTN